MTESRSNELRLELTSRIVSAYLSRNVIAPSELPHLIQQTYGSLGKTSEPAKTPATVEEQRPAVPIKKSVTDDFIVCLEDGKSFKSLKRHLMAKYALTPEQYREKWKLPAEYPMVAPNYARKRSELARATGLGKKSAAKLSPSLQPVRSVWSSADPVRREVPIASEYVTKGGNPMTDWRDLTEEDAIHTAVDEHGKDATGISSPLRS